MPKESATTIIRLDERPWWPLQQSEDASVKVSKVEPGGPNGIDNPMPDGGALAFDVEAFRLIEEGDIGAALERVGLA